MKTVFARSRETDQLIALFREVPVGVPMSFRDASKAVKFEVKSTLGAYHSARRIAAKEHGIVIEAIHKFGFKRLNPQAIVDRLPGHSRRVRRHAHRVVHEMEIAITGNLDRDAMMRAMDGHQRFRLIETTTVPLRAASNKPEVEPPVKEAPVDNLAFLRKAK